MHKSDNDEILIPDDRHFFNPSAQIEMHHHKLPHWQQKDVYIFITWRLADSVPQTVLDNWNEERRTWLKLHPKAWDAKTELEYHKRFTVVIEEWLDKNMGSCVLRDPKISGLMKKTLLHFEGERHEHESFVIMPNHVHTLTKIIPPFKLGEVVKSWRGYSAYEINKLLGRKGALWGDEYWDRLVRNPQHYLRCKKYIRSNPEKAHLHQDEYILYEKKLCE